MSAPAEPTSHDEYSAALDELTDVPALIVEYARKAHLAPPKLSPNGPRILRSLRATPPSFWTRVREAFSQQDITSLACEPTPGGGLNAVGELVAYLEYAGVGTLARSPAQQRAARDRILRASCALRAALDDELDTDRDGDSGRIRVSGFGVRFALAEALSDDELPVKVTALPEGECSTAARREVHHRNGDVALQDVLVIIESRIATESPVTSGSRQRESRQRVFTRQLVEWFDHHDTSARKVCIDAAAAILRDRYPDMKLVADPLT